MRKFRINNDIPIRWRILHKESLEPFDLDGKEVNLCLESRFGIVPIETFDVNGNEISFTFMAADQSFLGVYTATARITDPLRKQTFTVDACNIFELVAHSCCMEVCEGEVVRTSAVEFGIYTEGGVPALQTSLTYAELVELRDQALLTPGMWYRILDYETTTVQEDTKAAGNLFDVIVLALSPTTLSEEARACISDRPGSAEYFANNDLVAWNISYCVDNDYKRFSWSPGDGMIYVEGLWLRNVGVIEIEGETWQLWYNRDYDMDEDDETIGYVATLGNNPDYASLVNIEDHRITKRDYSEIIKRHEKGKGVIYRMIDENNIDCPYDFKNILCKFKVEPEDWFISDEGSIEKWLYTISRYNEDPSANGEDMSVKWREAISEDSTHRPLNISIQASHNSEGSAQVINKITISQSVYYDPPFYVAPRDVRFGAGCSSCALSENVKGVEVGVSSRDIYMSFADNVRVGKNCLDVKCSRLEIGSEISDFSRRISIYGYCFVKIGANSSNITIQLSDGQYIFEPGTVNVSLRDVLDPSGTIFVFKSASNCELDSRFFEDIDVEKEVVLGRSAQGELRCYNIFG